MLTSWGLAIKIPFFIKIASLLSLLVCVFNDTHDGYVYFGWNRFVREPGDVTVLAKAQENASSKDVTVFLVETAPSSLYVLSRPQYTPCVLPSLSRQSTYRKLIP